MGHLLMYIRPNRCLPAEIPRYYPSLNSISLCLVAQWTLPSDHNRFAHYQGFACAIPPTTCLHPLQVPRTSVSLALGLSPQHTSHPRIFRAYILPCCPILMQPDLLNPWEEMAFCLAHVLLSVALPEHPHRVNSLTLLTFIFSLSFVFVPLHLKSHASQMCSFLLGVSSQVPLSPSTHWPKLGKVGMSLAPSFPTFS